MLDAAIRGRQATMPAQVVQEQEIVSTEPVQVTNGQAKAPATVAVQQTNGSGEQTTETPVVTTNTPTPTPVKTATPVASTTTDADGEGETPGVTKTIPVTPTPVASTATETKVPTWEEIVNELSKADEESEETKANMKKKKRIATAIAALGDLATHAINVWGASNGYSAPIKGAPLTEGIANQHKLQLAEHDARLEKLKKLRLDAAEARRKDLYDRIKLGEFQRKEREIADKAEYNELRELKIKAEIKYREAMTAYRNAKTEQDKEKHRKELKKYDAQIANYEDLMAKRGTSSSSSKRTYTVDGVTYDNLAEAYIALPPEAQIEIKHDLNGRPIKPTEFEREEAIAKYNRDKKTSPAEQPAQQGKKEEKPKATSLKVNADGTKEVTFS